MINRENVVFNERIYYTPSWTGVTKIAILAAYNKGKLLVQAKNDPFIRTEDYVFDENWKARKAMKEWQHYDRKRRRLKKERRHAKKNNPKTER